MHPSIRLSNWKYWLGGSLLVGGLAVCVVLYVMQHLPGPQPVQARENAQNDNNSNTEDTTPPSYLTVDVVHPQQGMDYTIEQPGSVHAFESVQLQAKVSGFLSKQNVDIGDRVKRGQVLAVIAVPELDKQLQRNHASLEQARAHVKQMEARVDSAEADHEAAKAAIIQAEANHKSAEAWVRYRDKVYHRRQELFDRASIEEALVDEAKEKFEASRETERAAKAAIATTQAHLTAMAAKIKQAKADVIGAESEIKVAQAELEKTQVMLDYAVIKAPFSGEICHRYFFESDFIRSAADGTTQPLLVIQRTDKLRVVVRLPDSAVPYLDKGDPAFVRIDSLPGKKFVGTVSRKAGSEDPATRLMHVEVDLPNPTGEIGDGMYGNVKILLDRFPKLLSIPLTSVVTAKAGQSGVWVVRDGHLQLQEVRLCKDNGERVAVTSGLKLDDLVVRNPSASCGVGVEAEARLIEEPPAMQAEP
jgi:HlyD family secretion protein